MRDFKEATRAARARLDAEEITVAERERVRRALFEGAERAGPRRLWLAASCAAALAAVTIIAYIGRSQQVDDGFAVVGSASCVTSVAHGVEVSSACASPPRLSMDGAEAELAAGSVLLRDQSELRLRQGRATFAVSKRKPRQPRFVVRVSAGAVVVTGTRFTVVENGQSGSVAVTEGTIEFHWIDGSVTPVPAGSALSWPQPAAPAEPSAGADDDEVPDDATPDEATEAPGATSVDRHGKAGAPPDAGAVLRRLLQLRTQNRFDEAIALLRAASSNRAYAPVQRERFGFELCNLVTQTQSTSKACACWRRHMRSFPESGRMGHLPEALHECR